MLGTNVNNDSSHCVLPGEARGRDDVHTGGHGVDGAVGRGIDQPGAAADMGHLQAAVSVHRSAARGEDSAL